MFPGSGRKVFGNLFLALFQRKTLVTGHETQWEEDGNGNNNDNEKWEGKVTRINYGNIRGEPWVIFFPPSPTSWLHFHHQLLDGWTAARYE